MTNKQRLIERNKKQRWRVKTGWASDRAWRLRNLEKVAAHRKLARAILSGAIVRPDNCQACGKKCKAEGHHPDYALALSVFWLCPQCHKQIHRGEA